MKVYENKEREVVTRRECVKLVCDVCGKEAEHPEDELWTASGKLEWHYSIDGDCAESDAIDLCYECCKSLAELIYYHKADLQQLIKARP